MKEGGFGEGWLEEGRKGRDRIEMVGYEREGRRRIQRVVGRGTKVMAA